MRPRSNERQACTARPKSSWRAPGTCQASKARRPRRSITVAPAGIFSTSSSGGPWASGSTPRRSKTRQASTAASRSDASSFSSSPSTASTFAAVAGLRGVSAQYSCTTAESSAVPTVRARAMISSLFMPSSGCRIGSGVAPAITARFGSVWEETWPSASPVTIAAARTRRATRSAARSISRLSSTCQSRESVRARRSSATRSKSTAWSRGREPADQRSQSTLATRSTPS